MRWKWVALAALPSLFLFILFFFVLHMKSPLVVLYNNTTPIDYTPRSLAKFSILIGILTRPDSYDRRHFLRLVYGIQSSPIAKTDIRFVFCNLTKEDQKMFIALEILRFNDIIILNCTENMNSGKTYTYFSSLPRILLHRYDYVMKADDDVFLRLEPLAMSLMPLPRTDLYYGFVIPCTSQNPFVEYMSGMGFVLSWDLVVWIGDSCIPVNYTNGPEDKLVGKWLTMGKKAKNRDTIAVEVPMVTRILTWSIETKTNVHLFILEQIERERGRREEVDKRVSP
ncbi:hypothetical protein IFM89_020413 [Coptis chinensis]|uniref:Hexosyltransferase n=1 Tax=Coptis chinensis TaxID=261450 RepID=A0A835LJ91_9MAGN|nr:hypothetical protein IFM89_020413 [Coptis chinensis]